MKNDQYVNEFGPQLTLLGKRTHRSELQWFLFHADAQPIPQPVPYFGMFVHCLTDHQGQSLVFTSERKSPGNPPKLVTNQTGRSPWIVEGSSKLLNFCTPKATRFDWTLPTTASFERNCLKLDHPEKSEWWYIYLCMGRIRQDLYRDPSRIQNAYGIGALEISADKWKPSQTCLETSLLSSCRFSCLITKGVDTKFHDRV